MINEDAPTMSAGNGGFSGSAAATGPVAGFDPLLGSNKKVKRRKYGTKKDVKEDKAKSDWNKIRKDRGDQKEFERAQAYIKKNPKFGLKKKDVKEGREERSGKDNYLPFKVCYDDAEPYVLYGRSVAEIKIQLRKIYRPENHKKIYVKRLYPNEVIKLYYDLRQRALTNQ